VRFLRGMLKVMRRRNNGLRVRESAIIFSSKYRVERGRP
jgi:hypothetical protein